MSSRIKPKRPRPKKCKQCKKTFQPKRQLQSCCSPKCALDKAIVDRKRKAADSFLQESKRIKKEDREAIKKKRDYISNHYPTQFNKTKEVVQRWAGGIRDAGKPCISCGTTADVQYCGGHYRTVGANKELALDTRNIHRQCNKNCNCELGGNVHGHGDTIGYRNGLINLYGQEYVDWLDGPHKPKHFSCEQLRDIRAFYAKLTREKNKDDSERTRFND